MLQAIGGFFEAIGDFFAGIWYSGLDDFLKELYSKYIRYLVRGCVITYVLFVGGLDLIGFLFNSDFPRTAYQFFLHSTTAQHWLIFAPFFIAACERWLISPPSNEPSDFSFRPSNGGLYGNARLASPEDLEPRTTSLTASMKEMFED